MGEGSMNGAAAEGCTNADDLITVSCSTTWAPRGMTPSRVSSATRGGRTLGFVIWGKFNKGMGAKVARRAAGSMARPRRVGGQRPAQTLLLRGPGRAEKRELWAGGLAYEKDHISLCASERWPDRFDGRGGAFW